MPTNPTHGDFDDMVSGAAADLRPICRALRNLITSRHTGFVEVVWLAQHIASYGVGPRKMSEHYAYIGVQGSHVNLGFYHGASLSDPDGLLEGTGKELRHIKIRSVADAGRAGVTELLNQAIADRARWANEA
ncbi:MAG: DUF1801 domain-containing protein [Opitutaceae bacterium]|jgi:hypothetical protein